MVIDGPWCKIAEFEAVTVQGCSANDLPASGVASRALLFFHFSNPWLELWL